MATTDKTLDTLKRAIGACGVRVMGDMVGRYDDAADPAQSGAMLARAGIRRSLWSYVEREMLVARPDWTRVKALHKAWVISNAWCDEGVAARKKATP